MVNEIEYWTHQYRVSHIAFYDDALLINPKGHTIPILEEGDREIFDVISTHLMASILEK